MPLPEQRHRAPPRRKSTPRGDDGRGEFAGNLVPLQQDDVQRLFHLILLNPSCGGQIALTSERSESLARRSIYRSG
jgi:hypothetical protein